MSRTAKRTAVPASAVPVTLRASWDHARIAWIALAALIALALGRALGVGLVADDVGILDAVSRGGIRRLLDGTIPGIQPVSLSRDLGFWIWGSMLGLRAQGMHAVALLLMLVAVLSVADATARLASWRAGLIAGAMLVLAPQAPTLIGWVPALPDAFALAAACGAVALALRGRAWLAALATLVAVAARETLFALPVVLSLAVLVTRRYGAAPAQGEESPPSPAAKWRRILSGAGPSWLAAALAVAARVALHAWPRGPVPPAHGERLIVPPGATAGIIPALQATPMLVLPVLIAAAFIVSGTARRTAADERAGARLGCGVALAVCAGIGLFSVQRGWADVESMTIWAGVAIALGIALDRANPWIARGVLVLLALLQFGAHHVAPVTAAADRTRPAINLALIGAGADPVTQLGATIAPLCEPLRRTPLAFLTGVAPDPMLSVLLAPLARVSCHDTTLDVRLLGDFRPDDAWHAFLVIHGDPNSNRITSEPANALIRARIGEGFLVHAHPEVAAACFEAALSERPDDPELAFPLALALTASGHDSAARASWESARARGAAPAPDTLASRLLFGAPADRAASARGAVVAAISALTRDPSDSTAARALGHALLAAGATRSAAIAWAVAWGRSGAATDLVEYGTALEELGEPDLAREAYQRALASGLPRPIYTRARERLAALGVAPDGQ